MCFFNAMSLLATMLASRYGRKADKVESWKDDMDRRRKAGQLYQELAEGVYNIPAYSEPRCVIVDGSDQLQVMQWGMIPRTASVADAENFNKKNWFKNARAEGIFETWPYKMCIRHQRCLIPSTGYFEYHYNDKGKTQPYFIFLSDRDLFSMAGIWETWVNPQTGEKIDSFTQITTEANSFMRKIHNGGAHPFRMPIILEKEDEDRWLDPNLSDEEIKGLMKPYPAEKMTAYPVSKTFRSMNPKDKNVIKPVQGDLFSEKPQNNKANNKKP